MGFLNNLFGAKEKQTDNNEKKTDDWAGNRNVIYNSPNFFNERLLIIGENSIFEAQYKNVNNYDEYSIILLGTNQPILPGENLLKYEVLVVVEIKQNANAIIKYDLNEKYMAYTLGIILATGLTDMDKIRNNPTIEEKLIKDEDLKKIIVNKDNYAFWTDCINALPQYAIDDNGEMVRYGDINTFKVPFMNINNNFSNENNLENIIKNSEYLHQRTLSAFVLIKFCYNESDIETQFKKLANKLNINNNDFQELSQDLNDLLLSTRYCHKIMFNNEIRDF